MNRAYVAKQMNIALKFLAQKLVMSESEQMEIADLYPAWEPGRAYKVDDIVKYGVNQDNETQLWKVIQAHTSQDSWTPDNAPSLFYKIGFTGDGMPIWTRPQGSHDAYNTGDKVSYKGKIYVSLIDGNVWDPDEYPAGWKEVLP